MRRLTAARLLALPATALMLQACLGTGTSSPEQPLPLLGLAPDAPAQAASPRLSPEEARAQAVAEIRAKAQAHATQHEAAPYPPVFAAHGPPLAIASEPKSETQLARELAGVRRQLESATDAEEVAELQQRMDELVALGRSHAEESEETIRAISQANQ